MAELPDFTKLVPGFEFLQGLVKNAGAAMPAVPGMSQWVAPTLDPEELDKRINELRTVQFWLEQNARLIGTTIQAMEVQRMTLATLKTMNVRMDDLRESMMAKVPQAATAFGPAAFASAFQTPAGSTPNATSATPAAAASAPSPASTQTAASTPASGSTAAGDGVAGAPAAAAVDPMQWWSALTQQFAAIAANALQDGKTEAERASEPAPASTRSAPSTSRRTTPK